MGTAPRMPWPLVSVSPERLHPGPIKTVGWGPAPVPGANTEWGNQWARMAVLSNEVTVQSVGVPVTGVARIVRAGGR